MAISLMSAPKKAGRKLLPLGESAYNKNWPQKMNDVLSRDILDATKEVLAEKKGDSSANPSKA